MTRWMLVRVLFLLVLRLFLLSVLFVLLIMGTGSVWPGWFASCFLPPLDPLLWGGGFTNNRSSHWFHRRRMEFCANASQSLELGTRR